MSGLLAAALLWVVSHVGIAGSRARGAVVDRLGENGFRAAFSVLSLISISLLVIAYRSAPYVAIWQAPAWMGWLLAIAMLFASVLFAASVTAPNATAVGQDALLQRAPTGIARVTRHPMLWSFAIWAAVHIMANGDAASLLFFGAFLITALAGMPSIDAKIAARDRDAWSRFAAATSVMPFAAIVAGRSRLMLSDIGWLPVVAGVATWGALLWAHPLVIGVSPFPPG